MDYYIDGGRIVIDEPVNFDIKHILDCGQVFRYEHKENHSRVISNDQLAEVSTDDKGRVIIHSTDSEYFAKYFDLDTDYQSIINKININPLMVCATEYGNGMRILAGDLAEIIISFIISANNNINRIKRSLNTISELLGKDMGGYKAFPDMSALSSVDTLFFSECGCGYRSPYLAATAQELNNGNLLNTIRELPTPQAATELMKLMGVGPKVADCILLFGMGRTDVFPTDTWIHKVYSQDFGGKLTNRVAIANYFLSIFGDLSGYAQQYLFYYKREYGKAR